MLTRINRLVRGEQSEDGIAMIAAIAVMAVSVVLTTIVLSAMMSGLGTTALTKASVQSQASGEAGINVARAAIGNDTCLTASTNGRFQSAVGELPKYDVQVQYLNGSVWANGCPPSNSNSIKIKATGSAQAAGSGSVSANNTVKVESVLTAPPVATISAGTGQALYGGATVALTGGSVITTNIPSTIYVKTGNLTCDGGAGIGGSVIVPNGNVTITAGCKIGGSIFTSGRLSIGGGANSGTFKVGGDIVAASMTMSGSGSGSTSITGSIWLTGTESSDISNFPVAGGIYANGPLTLSSMNVAGNVITTGPLTISNGSSLATGSVSGSTVNLSNSGTVAGSVFATGNITSNSTVTRDVISTAGNVTLGNGTVGGGVWAGGGTFTNTYSRDVAGTLVAKNATLAGGKVSGVVYISQVATINAYYDSTVLRGYAGSKAGSNVPQAPNIAAGWNGTTPAAPSASGPPAAATVPTTPAVPPWIDYVYAASDWPSFTTVLMSGASCTRSEFHAALTAIGGNKGVIDARSCANGVDLGNQGSEVFTLGNDLLVLTKKFSIQSGKFTSASVHKLYLLQEDLTPDHQPTCGTQSMSIASGGSAQFDANVQVMIYTPCAVNIGSPGQAINGQIYTGGGATLGANASINFIPVGIPGYDLDSGESGSGSGSTNRIWTMSSMRNGG